MSEQQTREALEERITTMSAECVRGIVGDRTIDGVPIAAYARVAPNCIMFCQPLIPERDIFIDFCLN
jgi:hypothetical protein